MPQVPSGGPRPMNTLGDRPNQQQSRNPFGDFVSGHVAKVLGNFKPRWTTAVREDSVTGPTNMLLTPLSNGDMHAAKKRKITRPGPLRQIEGDEESDESDILGRADTQVESLKVSTDFGQVRPNLVSALATKRDSFRQQSSEYEDVEAMMNSNNYARQQASQGKRGRSSKVSKMQPREMNSSSIDLTGPEPPATTTSTKASYKGTARTSAASSHTAFSRTSVRQRQTGHTSGYFGSQPTAHAVRVPAISEQGVIRPIQRNGQYDRPGKKIVQVDARLQSAEMISSDELGMDEIEDYGSVLRVSPEKSIGRVVPGKSSFQQSSDAGQARDGLEVEPSNIKPTLFTGAVRKMGLPQASSKRRKHREPSDLDGFEACRIIMGSTHIIADEKGLGVVFNDADKKLEIFHDGLNLSEKDPDLRIHMPALLRIISAADCLKLVLEFARRAGQTSTWTAIELKSQRDVTILTNLLQDRTPQVSLVLGTSDRLNRIFERHQSDLSVKRTVVHDDIVDEGDEIRAMKRRKQLREGNSLQDMITEPMQRKRGRLRGTIGEKILELAVFEEDERTNGTDIGHSTSNRFLDATQDTKTANKPKPEIGNDEVMEKIIGQTCDGRLTRSTRSNVTYGSSVMAEDELTSLIGEVPEELRYSKRHNIGPRWKKAFVYPSTGKKKTTVEFCDLERLDEGQFLNDNLLGFYLRYLECSLEERKPEFAKKIYWFNTYFFASLTQKVKGKRGINYDAVRKWTRNIDIFSYDYAVVPINESAHWYVAVICNLRELNRIPSLDVGGPSSSLIEESDGPQEPKRKLEQDMLHSSQELDLDITEAEGARESFAELKLDEKDVAKCLSEKLSGASDEVMPDKTGIESKSGSQKQLLNGEPRKEGGAARNPNTPVAKELSPGNIPSSQKKGKRKSTPPARAINSRQPAIITLDSLGLAHSPTVRLLKDYLHAEANDKRGGMQWEDLQVKGITAKQIPLQTNYCDCGLFLLGYMDKFVEDPRDFVTKLLQREYDEIRDWPNLNPSVMRTNIRELVQGLHAEQEGAKSAARRNSPIKASAPPTGEDPAPMADTSFDAVLEELSKATFTADDPKDVFPNECEGHRQRLQSTRAEALRGALRVDEAEPNLQSPAEELFYEDPDLAEDSTADLPSIVLDSQEEPTSEIPVITKSDRPTRAPRAQSREPIWEIPATPPRPSTRGTSRPDIEELDASPPPKRGTKPRGGVETQVQEEQEFIEVDDD